MSMFNEDQLDHMRSLAAIPPQEKCYCGWYRLGECPNGCPPDKNNLDKLYEELHKLRGEAYTSMRQRVGAMERIRLLRKRGVSIRVKDALDQVQAELEKTRW
jgi:hypothetical protein